MMPRMLCRRCRLPNSTPRRKLTTTTLSSEQQQQQRVVISRRVYQAFQKQQQQAKGNHPSPSTKTKPKSADDKPWPQNVRIAGYVAGSFFVPYSLVWFVTSNPSLRDSSSVLQNFVNQEWIRQHFGEAEWDAKSYADSHEDLVAEDYTYPSELWNRNERLLEKTITTMEQEEVPTTINVYTTANGNGNETMSTTSTSTTKMLPGSTRANRQTLMELQQSNSSGGATENDDSYVTVDFPQDDDDKTTITTSHNDDLDSSLSLSVDGEKVDDPTLPLLQQTHTFSNWQYHQTASSSSSSDGSGNGGGRGVVRMTDQQAELANLEFTIQELETLLQDPNCPRDMDDVRDELKESKRKLFRKRWKQRLGF